MPPCGEPAALTRARPCSVRPSSTRPSATPRARSAPVETLPVDGTGRLDVEALRARLGAAALPRPALVHCQWANHEVGTLQPVHEVVALCREAGVTVHVDAAAACGHVPTDLGRARRRPGERQRPQARRRARGRARSWCGGAADSNRCWSGVQQERGRRGGLEPIPALLAFGAAAAALAIDGGRAMVDEAAAARRADRGDGARRAGPGRRRGRRARPIPTTGFPT